MFSRWIVTNITSASVTTFPAFLVGIISWSVYCSYSSLIAKSYACAYVEYLAGIFLWTVDCTLSRVQIVHSVITNEHW
jgi:hypothetical protein